MVALCDGGKRWNFGGLVLYASLFSLILPASSFGQILDSIALAKKVQPSVVLVLERESSGKVIATGSGFLVSADGKLVTNDHGSKTAEDLSAQAADGRVLRVQSILERDPAHDRELLQLAAEGLPFLPVAASLSVHPGELLAIVPSRFAGRNAVSLGTAFVERSLFGPSRLLVATEAVARLYPGAPVVGSEGQVLGVATTRSRAKPGQLLIPVATIGKLTVLPAGGSPKQGAVAPLQTASERAGATPVVDVGKAPKTPGAGQAVEELVPRSPRETGGAEGIAWALLKHGNYEKAAAAFEEELHRKSSDARAWLGFGLAKQHLGQTEEASAAFRQAVALSPSSGQAWCELGRVDLERKRYREAAGSFERAVRLQPQDARAWLGVAAANLAMERRQEALAALGRVQVSDPADTAIWRGIGELYSRLGRPEDASTAFQRAVDRNPGDARAWLGLGLTSVELGRMERAQEILPKLFVLDPDLGAELVQALKTR